MARIVLPHRRQRQPPGYIAPDLGNHLLQGFRFALPGGEMGPYGPVWTRAGPTGLTWSGTPATVVNQEGRGLSFDGSTYVNLGDAFAMPTKATPFTLAWFEINRTSSSGFQGAITLSASDAAARWVFGRTNSAPYNNCFYGYADGTAIIGNNTIPALAVNVPHLFVVTCTTGLGTTSSNFGNYAIWVDGVNYGSTSANGGFSTQGTLHNYLGWDGANSNFQGVLSSFLFIDRVWANHEIEDFTDNPWQIYRYHPRRLYVSVPAGGGTDISTTVGTETWNGIAASLDLRTNVSTTIGTETWNGLASSVKMSPIILATTGVETWNGLNANIIAPTVISATTGVETWGTTNASVNARTAITATVGSETWNGISATIRANTNILTALGVETWNGLASSVVIVGGAVNIQATTGIETWGAVGSGASITGGGISGGVLHQFRVFRAGRGARRGPIYSLIQTSGAAAPFSPIDRSDLLNWYRKGIGQTDVSGLTVWIDQKGTDDVNQVVGVKGVINGNGTVTWSDNGLIYIDTNTGYGGRFDDGVAYVAPWAMYARIYVDSRDGSAHSIFGAGGNGSDIVIGYAATGAPIDELLINDLTPFHTDGSDIVGHWYSIAITGGAAAIAVRCSGGTVVGAGSPQGLKAVAIGGGHGLFGSVTIAEVVVFQGVEHVAADIDQMFAYLATVIS